MPIGTDGAVSLLPPSSRYVNPLYQFWRQHRDLFDDANCLWAEVAGIPGLCQRLLAYVSTDLYWVTREGASPIVFDAFAAGLLSYRASRNDKAEKKSCTTSLDSYRAFVDAVLDHAAMRLGSIMLLNGRDSWSPATGTPLQPWLARQPDDMAVLRRSFGDAHEQRVRAAVRDYILDPSDKHIFGLDGSFEGLSRLHH